MKKFYALLLPFIATIPLSAQQLPNANFEQAWVSCVPWVGTNGDMSGNMINSNSTAQGTTPTGWMVSNTRGADGTGKCTVGSQVAGYTGNGVKVAHTKITVIFVTKTIPGYLTLGTPWSTSTGMGANMDGGTFGGIDFAYRPDAISFYYKSDGSDQPHFIAYAWKGTYKQENVPASITTSSNPNKVTMVDRDRNILGKATEQGGNLIQSGECITQIEERLSATASSWTKAEFPFDYKGNTSMPEKFNVIFGAGDYFTTSPSKDNSITVDDVTLIYYSRLSDLKVNGTTVDGFSSTVYDYDLSSVEMPADASAIAYELLTNSGSSSATVNLDTENAKAVVTVTNSNNGADIDGSVSHTYTIQFKKPEAEKPVYGGTVYYGTVTIHPIDGLSEEDMVLPDNNVHIIENGDGTCTFVLPDFALGEDPSARIGDIIVENVSMTSTSDGYTYAGSTKGLALKMGDTDIMANVDLTGFTKSNGEAKMDIKVKWLNNYPDETTGIDINVEFNAYPVTIYNGTVHIDDFGLGQDVTTVGTVYIYQTGQGICTLKLPNFSLGEGAEIGDIVVENVTMTEAAGGGYSYNGSTRHLGLMPDESGTPQIVANVEVEGNSSAAGDCQLLIHVKWLQDVANDPEGNTSYTMIGVQFNGKRQVAGIDEIFSDDENAPVEIYNIHGMRVYRDNLMPGIYIRRQGSKVEKIFVR